MFVLVERKHKNLNSHTETLHKHTSCIWGYTYFILGEFLILHTLKVEFGNRQKWGKKTTDKGTHKKTHLCKYIYGDNIENIRGWKWVLRVV